MCISGDDVTDDLSYEENQEYWEHTKGRLPFFFGQGKIGASQERLQRDGDV